MCDMRRGYPDPDYTEDDVMDTETILDENKLVTIETDHFENLVSKAAAMDIMENAIRFTGHVNEELVRAVSWTLDSVEMVPKTDADAYWSFYMAEKKKAEGLAKQVAGMEKVQKELAGILRQNGICVNGMGIDMDKGGNG